ncbi:MAG: TetR/AcrR family transcriptional regulator [Actinomycetota bacterium]|nr:TetR/AcrR family transcriptional regulator [Actinomycetota bacterium]
MPKLWTDTVEEHRRAVRDATLDAAAKLVAEHGMAAVTMSKIAAETGIGRATLYKYFPDLEAILLAWHERQVNSHLEQLDRIRAQAGPPGRRLEAVLAAYAGLTRARPHDAGLSAALHRGEHVLEAHQHLASLVEGLLAEAAGTGEVRDDVPPGELADYCLHALAAASRLREEAAVRRLVTVTLDGLRPPGRLRSARSPQAHPGPAAVRGG